jgi:hypothetical protein
VRLWELLLPEADTTVAPPWFGSGLQNGQPHFVVEDFIKDVAGVADAGRDDLCQGCFYRELVCGSVMVIVVPRSGSLATSMVPP